MSRPARGPAEATRLGPRRPRLHQTSHAVREAAAGDRVVRSKGRRLSRDWSSGVLQGAHEEAFGGGGGWEGGDED